MPECSGISQRGIFSTRSVAAGANKKEGVEIKCHSDTGANKMYFQLRVSPKGYVSLVGEFTTAMGAWVHATVVWAVGYDLTVYENGQYLDHKNVDMNSTTGPYYHNTNPGLMVFGRHYTNGQQGGASDYATGFVDGVKIYNHPLNATEVLALYNSDENEY